MHFLHSRVHRVHSCVNIQLTTLLLLVPRWMCATTGAIAEKTCSGLDVANPTLDERSTNGKAMLQMGFKRPLLETTKKPVHGKDRIFRFGAAAGDGQSPESESLSTADQMSKRLDKHPVSDDHGTKGSTKVPTDVAQKARGRNTAPVVAQIEQAEGVSATLEKRASHLQFDSIGRPISFTAVGLLLSMVAVAVWISVASAKKSNSDLDSKALDAPQGRMCPMPVLSRNHSSFAIPVMNCRDLRTTELVFDVTELPAGRPLQAKISCQLIGSKFARSEIRLSRGTVPLASCSVVSAVEAEDRPVQEMRWLSVLKEGKSEGISFANKLVELVGSKSQERVFLAGATDVLLNSSLKHATDGKNLRLELCNGVGELQGTLEYKAFNKFSVKLNHQAEITIAINFPEDWMTLSIEKDLVAVAKGFGQKESIQVDVENDDQLMPYLLLSALAVIVFDLKIDTETGDLIATARKSDSSAVAENFAMSHDVDTESSDSEVSPRTECPKRYARPIAWASPRGGQAVSQPCVDTSPTI